VKAVTLFGKLWNRSKTLTLKGLQKEKKASRYKKLAPKCMLSLCTRLMILAAIS